MKKVLLIVFIAVLVLAILGGCGGDDKKAMTVSENTELKISSESLQITYDERKTTISTIANDEVEEAPLPLIEAEETSANEATPFEITFFDVGQADSAIVKCDGMTMLIDGGNPDDSSLIYSYLKQNDIDHLNYIVATHAHEDHVGGLSGALLYATVDTVLCSTDKSDNKAFIDFVKYLEKQNIEISIPAVGDVFDLGSSKVEILAPSGPGSVENNNSIVLRIVYGDTSFLFMGDAEYEEETELSDKGYNIKSTVLKVGHHGSGDATSTALMLNAEPDYAIISVGKDNPHNHPAAEVLNCLKEANVTLFRTDLQGSIVCISDGKTVSFTVEKNPDIDTFLIATPTPVPTATPAIDNACEQTYILNTNTHKFHYEGCSSVRQMKDSNKRVFEGTREEVIALGYQPCGNCNP